MPGKSPVAVHETHAALAATASDWSVADTITATVAGFDLDGRILSCVERGFSTDHAEGWRLALDCGDVFPLQIVG